MDATPLREDPSLLLTALTSWTHTRVRDQLTAAGYGDLRKSHDHVFRHLQAGPLTVRDLADRMSVTAQAASKSTGELEHLGYVIRRTTSDQRVRLIELTEHGWAAITTGRISRAAVNAELRQRLGPAAESFCKNLRTLAEDTGALDEQTLRTLRLPD